LQIAPLFAIQTELAVTGDTMETKYGIPASMDNNTLMIPLLAKFTFRPGIWLFAVFGGAYVSIPLREMVFTAGGRTYRYNYEPVMGYTAGVNAGVKFGPGTLFMDIRYGGDFSDTQLSGSWGSEAVYKRNQLFYALGYEIGFGNRKGK
jgi:hypothetical protein